MRRRLKVYFIHSNKIDYNNLLYRHILASQVCLKHELMLPQTKQYQTKYVKELINSADIIIAEISKPGFGLNLELNWALKSGKPIKFISLTNVIPKKYRKKVKEIELTSDNKTLINIIETFINYYAGMSEAEQKDTTVLLGEI